MTSIIIAEFNASYSLRRLSSSPFCSNLSNLVLASANAIESAKVLVVQLFPPSLILAFARAPKYNRSSYSKYGFAPMRALVPVEQIV
jgi:hypothetical protein